MALQIRNLFAWQARQIVGIVALLGLVVSLLFGLLLPVYSDEFGWRLQERAWIDGIDIGYNDICGPNTLARPPIMMMPVRAFSAWMNMHLASPLFIRLEGIACALAIVGLFGILIRRLEPDRARSWKLTAIACVLLGLGVLPLILVMSRPEQPVMMVTLLILLITFSGDSTRVGVWGASWRVIAILGLSTIAQSYHLKGVLYAGVPAIGIVMCSRRKVTWPVRLVGLVVLIGATALSAHYWLSRFACTGDPILSDLLAHENVVAALANNTSINGIVRVLAAGLNPFNYVVLAVPPQEPMSSWLPFGTFPVAVTLVFIVALLVAWLGVFVLTIIAIVRFVWTSRLAALGEPRLWLAVVLIGTIEVWDVSQIRRNTYEIAHIMPALVITMLLAFTLPAQGSCRWPKLPTRLIGACVGLALVSEAVVMLFAFPALAPAFGKGGYPARQRASVAIGNYAETRAEIHRAMQNAGFPQGRRLHRLLVDELTYMALQDSDKPLFRLGVLSTWNGGITDPESYLRSRDSDGVVMACDNLPDGMRRMAIQVGAVCAIPGARLGGH